MDYDSNLVRFFILAPIFPDLVILYALFRKNLQRELFWFLAYLCSFVMLEPVLFTIYQLHKPYLYFYASWLFEGIALVLAFMVILEVFRNVLVGYRALRRLAVTFLAVTGFSIIALAIYVGGFGAPGSHPQVAFMLVMERSVRIIQVGLIVALFGFVSFVGLNWKNHVFGIALGYGLYAACSLAISAYAAEVGAAVGYKVFLLDQCAYLCMIAIWMTYILQPEPAKRVLFPASARQDLQKWNEALAGYVGK